MAGSELRVKLHPKKLAQDFFYRSQTFCCCLPVRVGVMVISLFTLLLSGILMIILWFLVSDSDGSLTSQAPLIAFALLQTFLFIFSVTGFSGSIVRKFSFIVPYAYFLYIHLVVNIAVAGYFLYEVTSLQSSAVLHACENTVQDAGAQEQCKGLFDTVVGVYAGVVSVLLLIEAYGALIMARYVHQIKNEKRVARVARASRLSALSSRSNSGFASANYDAKRPPHSKHVSTSSTAPLASNAQHDRHLSNGTTLGAPTPGGFPTRSGSVSTVTPMHTGVGAYTGLPTHREEESAEFDPYRNYNASPAPPALAGTSPPAGSAGDRDSGYGGGTWTHASIATEEQTEKEREGKEERAGAMGRTTSGRSGETLPRYPSIRQHV